MSDSAPRPPRRRVDDAAIVLFTGIRDADEGITADLGNFQPTPELLANSAFVIDVGGPEALVVPAADAHLLPRGEGGEELRARVRAMTQALRRERDWRARRLRMPDHLLGYADALQRARTEADVYEAIRTTAVPVVGAYTALVFIAAGADADPAYHPLGDPAVRSSWAPLPAATALDFLEQRLVTRADIAADRRGVLAPFTAILDEVGAAQLLCQPVGGDALLVLIERRQDRVLTGEDRDVLDALVRQAEAALRRIASEQELAALALTDPATGLPAGRHVEIIVDRALAMARRGQPLTMMLVSIDQGGPGGPSADRENARHWLSACLREQLRAIDLAVYQGGDRFLVLLADTDAAGARRVIERIEAQAAGTLTMTAGVAVFGPGQDTVEQLASAAAADLRARREEPG